MKNNTKLIMETWRRFLNEDNVDDDPQGLDAPGFHDDYAPDMPEDEADSEVYGVDDEGYDETGRDFQSRYGQHHDPEDPMPTGDQVPADPDMIDDSDELSDEQYYGLSMDDSSEDDYFGHDF